MYNISIMYVDYVDQYDVPVHVIVVVSNASAAGGF